MASPRFPFRSRRPIFRVHALALSLIAAGLLSPVALAAPEGGVVRAGQASIQADGSLTRIQQTSDRAIIDWRSFGTTAGESVRFNQPSTTSATLNRVTGGQTSVLLGRLDANGQVFLINPHGIIFGKGAQINVGGLVAATADIGNQDFMAGRLIFSQPGQPGASVINAGEITVAEGGLVALVAPQVRNDGIITARLGRVALAAGETFTLDLYGDRLINLAMSDARVGQLFDAGGQPVTPQVIHTGTIDAAGGRVVLVTAATGKSVLDEVINLSGVIRADTVGQRGGEILLLGQGGTVNVGGSLSAAGRDAGQRGGRIEVLGDHVTLAAGARLDASGQAGGGTLHVGGAWQGQGDSYRAQDVLVAAGAQLAADALGQGDGGEVVVWSDGHTAYSGNISARGGQAGGNGSRVEVSGKQTLDFNGDVDLAAPNGLSGSLLLDPTYFSIGLTEASLLNRILRTGASTTLQADVDININAMIDGRGRYAGGGLTLIAGNDININNYLVTYNGTVRLNAGSDINIAPGYAVFTGQGALYATSGNTLTNLGLISANLLHLTSTAGNVNIDTVGIDAGIGNVVLDAAIDVNIGQPVINLKNGSSFTARAGSNVNVNAQIDGSGGTAGGVVSLTATSGIVNINEHVVTNNGAIAVAAGSTVNQLAAGNDSYGAPMTKQLRAGNAAISVTAGGNLSPGSLVTTGNINVASTGGNVTIDVPIYETVGNATITAGGNIDINQVVANTTSGGNLTMTAGGMIDVDAKPGPWDRATGSIIDRNALPGGRIALTAAGNININTDIASYKGTLTGADDASIRLISTGGLINLASGKKVMSDQGSIYASSYGNLQNAFAPANVNDPVDMGFLTTGPLTLISTHGNVDINQTIPNTTGNLTINAGDALNINQRIYTNDANITLTAGAGGIHMNPAFDPEPNAILNTYYVSDVDTRTGNIWIEATGDIYIAGVRTDANLTIKSTNGWLYGCTGINCGTGLMNILESRNPSGQMVGNGYPNLIELAGAAGIYKFNTDTSPNVHAISTQGSVDSLSVYHPHRLEVIARNDIVMGGQLGSNVSLYAGRDVSLSGLIVGDIEAKAGRNLAVTGGQPLGNPPYATNQPTILASSIDFSAGTNPFTGLTSTIAGLAPPAWQGSYGPTEGNVSVSNYIWVEGTGGMTVNAANSITLPEVHVSYYLFTENQTTDVQQTLQPFTLNAGGNITLKQIETMGPVSLTSAGGDITVQTTIGPHVSVETPSPYLWNPYDKGVASLSIFANGPGAQITMKEARAEGDITIAATYPGTDNTTRGVIHYSNEFDPAANVGFQTTNGTVSIYDWYDSTWNDPLVPGSHYYHYLTPAQAAVIYPANPGWWDYVTTISPNIKARLPGPSGFSPVASPGPTFAGPPAPIVPGALPPGAPGAANVAGMTAPGASGDSLPEIFVPEPSTQITAQGEGGTGTTLTEAEQQALAAALAGGGTTATSGALNPLAFDTATGAFLVFAGGRGDALDEERRR